MKYILSANRKERIKVFEKGDRVIYTNSLTNESKMATIWCRSHHEEEIVYEINVDGIDKVDIIPEKYLSEV